MTERERQILRERKSELADIWNHVANKRYDHAREALIDIKRRWEEICKEMAGTMFADIIAEAMTRLPKANTKPARWHSYLYDAEGDFAFHIG
jgi:hypothetical protein